MDLKWLRKCAWYLARIWLLTLLLIGAASLFSGCGEGRNVEVVGVTSQGIQVAYRPLLTQMLVSIEDVGVMADITARLYSQILDVPLEEVEAVWDRRNVTIEILGFEETLETCWISNGNYTCGPVSGLFDAPDFMQVKLRARYDCVADNAFSHEFVHLLHHHITGDANGDHDDPALWGVDGVSVTSKLESARVLCPFP